MLIFRSLGGVLLLCAMMFGNVPVLDKSKLESYIRYAEGFLDNVHFTIDDPVASSVPNFYQINVHLTTDQGAKLDRVYFLTPDGKEVIRGSVWDTTKSPFAQALAEMPDGGYAFGPLAAKVKLVVFSDFECPYCREFAKTVRDNIPKKYPKDVRVVFEDFPLEAIHPWARAAAEASHCIGDQNASLFWDYHDWIFEQAASIKKEDLRPKILAWATEKKLDTPRLQTCMDTNAEAALVSKSESSGRLLMIQQTPTSFANGREIPAALPWKDLDIVIQMELKHVSDTASPLATK